jgi:hypothetical protein
MARLRVFSIRVFLEDSTRWVGGATGERRVLFLGFLGFMQETIILCEGKSRDFLDFVQKSSESSLVVLNKSVMKKNRITKIVIPYSSTLSQTTCKILIIFSE